MAVKQFTRTIATALVVAFSLTLTPYPADADLTRKAVRGGRWGGQC